MWWMHMDGCVDMLMYIYIPIAFDMMLNPHFQWGKKKKKRMGNSISYIPSELGSFQIILLW